MSCSLSSQMFIDLGAEFDLQAATFVAPVTLAVLPDKAANDGQPL